MKPVLYQETLKLRQISFTYNMDLPQSGRFQKLLDEERQIVGENNDLKPALVTRLDQFSNARNEWKTW